MKKNKTTIPVKKKKRYYNYTGGMSADCMDGDEMAKAKHYCLDCEKYFSRCRSFTCPCCGAEMQEL